MGSVCDPFGWLSDHKVPSVPEPEKNLKLVKCPVGSGRFVIFSTSKMKVLASENKLVPNSTTHCWKSLKLSAFPFKIWLIMDGIGSFVRNYITPPTGRIGIEVILFCGILTKMVKLLKCQSQSLTFSFTFPFSPLGRSPSPTFTDWYNSLFFASWMKFPHSTSNMSFIPRTWVVTASCLLRIEPPTFRYLRVESTYSDLSQRCQGGGLARWLHHSPQPPDILRPLHLFIFYWDKKPHLESEWEDVMDSSELNEKYLG